MHLQHSWSSGPGFASPFSIEPVADLVFPHSIGGTHTAYECPWGKERVKRELSRSSRYVLAIMPPSTQSNQ